jgi:long-chain acyl-CoA synthetase
VANADLTAIFGRAATEPDGVAIRDDRAERTWSELLDRVVRLANGLTDQLGVAPDGHVAALLPNRSELVELAIAGPLAGLWVTPINRHLTADEVAYVVEDSGASVVLTDAALVDHVPDGVRVVDVDRELPGLIDAFSDAPPDLDATAGGSMLYTSGTTGRPKGVRRGRPPSRRAVIEGARRYGGAVGLDGSGPHLVTGPLYHAAPLGLAIYDLYAGAPMVIMDRFDALGTLEAIETHAIEHTHLVPTMFVRMLRLSEAERAAHDHSSLSCVLHGAAPVSPAVKRSMIEWWGPVLVEYWGGSESGVVTLVDSETWLAHPGTVGRTVGSWEVFAADDDGARLPAGHTGMLYCRNASLGSVFEYHQAPEKTAAARLDAQTFTLGDIGRVDEDGYVYLADRAAHTIISGGVNIYPAEIEAVLQEHPAVADLAVFGIPDEEWGEQVKAAVCLHDGFTWSDELQSDFAAFARERLAGFKVPRSWDVHDELPRHPTGKLHVRRLRAPYWPD